eukprot:11185900-Alexandrium_andersonii.AAC.1
MRITRDPGGGTSSPLGSVTEEGIGIGIHPTRCRNMTGDHVSRAREVVERGAMLGLEGAVISPPARRLR